MKPEFVRRLKEIVEQLNQIIQEAEADEPESDAPVVSRAPETLAKDKDRMLENDEIRFPENIGPHFGV